MNNEIDQAQVTWAINRSDYLARQVQRNLDCALKALKRAYEQTSEWDRVTDGIPFDQLHLAHVPATLRGTATEVYEHADMIGRHF